MISGREAYGAYTKFATETAILAITVAKSPFFLPYDDGSFTLMDTYRVKLTASCSPDELAGPVLCEFTETSK